MAVNPLSRKIYIAVQSNDGTPILLTLEGDKLQSVNLNDIAYSTISIANVPGEMQRTEAAVHYGTKLSPILIMQMVVLC